MGALDGLGFPTPTKTNESSTGKKIAGGAAGCAVGAGAGFWGTKAMEKLLKKDGYTSKQVNQAAIVVAGLGCVVGGSLAVSIIKNMDAKSKKAQEEAWKRAQAQTETQATSAPQAWKTDTHEGVVSIINPEINADGQQCATRKNFVKSASGEAEQYTPVCKYGSGRYQPATS